MEIATPAEEERGNNTRTNNAHYQGGWSSALKAHCSGDDRCTGPYHQQHGSGADKELML
jgi:hypothetical protein